MHTCVCVHYVWVLEHSCICVEVRDQPCCFFQAPPTLPFGGSLSLAWSLLIRLDSLTTESLRSTHLHCPIPMLRL